MPRKQFIADLRKAQDGVAPPGVRSIRSGDDDGQFEFEFEFEFVAASTAHDLHQAVNITAMISDVSEYPSSHDYMLFCADDAPHHVAKALQGIRNTGRKTVSALIQLVSASLSALTLNSDSDLPMGEAISDEEDQFEEDEDADSIYADDDISWNLGSSAPDVTTAHLPTTHRAAVADKSFRDRVRSDLRAAKDAGFRVGHLGPLLEGYSSFVTVSIRMSKLGISDEAMQAWKLDRTEYFILVIQYPNGYKTNEQLQACTGSTRLTPNICVRAFAGRRYKPSLHEAIKAFTKVREDRPSTTGNATGSAEVAAEQSSIHGTFISKSLSTLLEEKLVALLRFRDAGMYWSGAEACYNHLQSASSGADPEVVLDKFYEPETINRALPMIMHGDHYRQPDIVQYSFPTLAMQFALRHFVRCTEFCMVCHRKLDNQLEAIKPYVCENPLCLFQYMSMGFGPSIEHEIIAQPYVVDLLISFCYSSAKSGSLKDFPEGLSLKVPFPTMQDYQISSNGYETPSSDQEVSSTPKTFVSYDVGFDRDRREIIFFNKADGGCPVSRGHWIVIRWGKHHPEANREELHCRVSDATFYPVISVDEPVVVPLVSVATHVQTNRPLSIAATATRVITDKINGPPDWTTASFSLYGQDFDDLNRIEKCHAIGKLLDTLPTVGEMRSYLSQSQPADLGNWVQRMSRDATSLLRWIIASNRACIMQVESESDNEATGTASHREERLHGAEGYMQFRFAMGAPDKESRFQSEVRKTTKCLKLQYPTIFAWHGSPLCNWHMIIREGLHFKNTAHGRAYGNGVYHAKDSVTSCGYAGMNHYGRGAWPKSMLRVSMALALNEIVNAPDEFKSKSPYYVVPQLDWIQTRYLLVQCSPTDDNIKPGVEVMPKHVHPQDPNHTPTGPQRLPITIPASAIKSGRRGQVTDGVENDDKRRSALWSGSVSKKLKGDQGFSIATAIDLDDIDTASDDSDVEDSKLLHPEVELDLDVATRHSKDQSESNGKAKASSNLTTNFVPGSLDFSTLPLMPMPTYATSATTRRLLTELNSLARVQAASCLASLGWYIDTEKIDNVYQWIVELHSFHTFSINDNPLPLVQDMKRAGVTSIILEIRFGPDFPFSPPYIRVVRPRFLPFTRGGGGHIVIGGAMCMELLTNTGWSSVMSMEAVLLQLRMAIASEPFARLEGKIHTSTHRVNDYGTSEAAEGYLRACASHGWQVPPGFKEVADGMSAQADAGANA
jgi:ubiquitin-conjugating enzyme E2 Q